MTSIRVCPISIAAADALDRASSSCSSGAVTLPSESISIPKHQRETKASRRVSFNLGENSVRHLPSNSAISKITQARTHKQISFGVSPPPNGSSYSLSDDCLTCCEDFEEQARVAERQAKSMLPQGASHELLDPRFAMTALYVKNGHIRALERKSAMLPALVLSDDGYSGDHCAEQPLAGMVPARGVLKPFAPSPIDASFFESSNMLGELSDEEEEEGENGGDDLSQLLRPPQPHYRRHTATSRRSGAKKGSKKKRIRNKKAPLSSDADDDIPSALPLPIPISTKM